MDNVRWHRETMVDWIDWDEFFADIPMAGTLADRRDQRDPTVVGGRIIVETQYQRVHRRVEGDYEPIFASIVADELARSLLI